MPMHRNREKIEYIMLLNFIIVGEKDIDPFFFTWEMIPRAMKNERMLVVYNV
jgi:hypothetical protein